MEFFVSLGLSFSSTKKNITLEDIDLMIKKMVVRTHQIHGLPVDLGGLLINLLWEHTDFRTDCRGNLMGYGYLEASLSTPGTLVQVDLMDKTFCIHDGWEHDDLGIIDQVDYKVCVYPSPMEDPVPIMEYWIPVDVSYGNYLRRNPDIVANLYGFKHLISLCY
ncbi:hypothetical protein [Mosqueiro virus]|uniref:Uncharacterized protein n=1 Tax=Mosqueiro virus TaxID=200403 RepID=A0A0D3R1M3_9RHAB|nr:hypothetical protein [Mosqueiro virus]AJR28521.1 hypothetical protein [Mosqueiro virus]